MSSIRRVTALTCRELQILELVALGYSAKEVALRCKIAPRTVETHLDTMRLKMRARNRTHMVALAIFYNLLFQGQISREKASLFRRDGDAAPEGADRLIEPA